MVSGLGVTELVSWGVLVYAFSVLVVPMRAELGWTTAVLNGAYATGVAISGLLAIPVGRRLQAYGARGVMTFGTVATVATLLLWSHVHSKAAFFAVFLIGGVAMATTLYEPVFAVTAAWFDRHRSRAVLVLTVFGGLASVVFVPLTATLVDAVGWRSALTVLAAIAAVVGLPVHGLLIRRRPADIGLHPDGAPQAPPSAPHHVTGRARSVLVLPSFWWLTACLVMSTAARFGVSVVLVAYLTDRGYALSTAALAAGGVGLFQVGGRLLVTALNSRLPEHLTTGAVFLGQGIGIAVPLCTTGAGAGATAAMVVFVVLFGLGFGMEALLRGALVPSYYGPSNFPSINGVLGAFVVGARAAGPLFAGLAVTALGGYQLVFVAASLMCCGSAITLVVAHRRRRVETAASTR